MPRVTLVIPRLNFFKTLGGVIDEALHRGHEVNLLYDLTMIGKFYKGIISPAPHLFPKFHNGIPKAVGFNGVANLSKTAKKISDVVVLHCGCVSDYEKYLDRPETCACQYQAIRKASIPVVSLHSHFYDNCLLELNAYDSVDVTCILSSYAYQLHQEMLMKASGLHGEKIVAFKNEIDEMMSKKVVITGSALFDLFNEMYKKQVNYHKKNIIFFVPKFYSNDPFMDVIASEHPRWLSIFKSIFSYRCRYLSKIWMYPKLGEILDRLEYLSKTYGYDIISKSRPKHGNAYERKLKAISKQYMAGDDDEYYPNYSSMEVLKNAKCCIHTRTSSVLESVIAGIPSIHLQIPFEDSTYNSSPKYSDFVKVIRSCAPETLFNFKGCVWNIPWDKALEFFDSIKMEEIEQDLERRDKYVQYFCGVEERTASARQVDVIESLL